MEQLNLNNIFDKDEYIKALIMIAKADGKVTDEERDFIESRGKLLDIDTTMLWSGINHLDDLNKIKSASHLIKMTIIYDCITLGYIDSEFGKSERIQVYKIASYLGLSNSVVDDIENWLKDYKNVLDRGQALMGYSFVD